jgi:hypothetical protein
MHCADVAVVLPVIVLDGIRLQKINTVPNEMNTSWHNIANRLKNFGFRVVHAPEASPNEQRLV